MRNLLGVLLSVLIGQAMVCAQSNELSVRNVKVDSFPSYTGELHVRNPEGIEINRVKFLTGDSLITVSLKEGTNAPSISKSKIVLFVVLNNPAHKGRTKWYKSVIGNALKGGMMKQGDQFAVVSFDCPRPEYDKENRHLLFPSVPVFTDNEQVVKDQLNEININQKRHSVCGRKGDIYGAIYAALDALNKVDSDLPKSIVILADDWSLTKQTKEQQIQKRSKDYDIPVYGITYDQNTSTGNWGVKSICEESYGAYFIDDKTNNSVVLAGQTLLDFGDDMISRASGMLYEFTFDANVPKSSETQTVKVQYEGKATSFQYSVPQMTALEWVYANPITSVGSIIGFIALIIVLIVLMKRRNRKAAEEKARHEEELRKVEEQQIAADLKTAQQEEEIGRMKDAALRKENEAREKKHRQDMAAENEQKLKQMMSRGNLPWFTFTFHEETGSFEVNHSEFSVGRDKNNNYCINLPIVSRKHFQIVFSEGTYVITDLNSANGTYVNGQRITSIELKHSDVVTIGDINLTFHI